jgi:uncharacterized protein YaiL (DUF2058 family)
MYRPSLIPLATAIFGFVMATYASANTISKITASTQAAEPNKPFSLTFTFAGNPASVGCGLAIDWGDGKVEKFRVGEGQQLSPPYTVEHTYASPGEYKLRISGEAMARGLRSVLGCDVKREGTIAVIDPVEAAKQAEAKAAAERERLAKQEIENQRMAAERAEAERERRERQESEARRLATERAESEAKRARQREQVTALINNKNASLGEKLAGACRVMFPDAKEYAVITNNAPMDSCDEVTLQNRIRSEYALIYVMKFVGTDRYEIIEIPSRGMRGKQISARSVRYTTKGDLMISDRNGCMTTERFEVGFDFIKTTGISMAGNCAEGQRMAFNRSKELGPETVRILRPDIK